MKERNHTISDKPRNESKSNSSQGKKVEVEDCRIEEERRNMREKSCKDKVVAGGGFLPENIAPRVAPWGIYCFKLGIHAELKEKSRFCA